MWETFGYSPNEQRRNRYEGYEDDFDASHYRRLARGKFDEEADIEQLLLEDGFEESAYRILPGEPDAIGPGLFVSTGRVGA